MSELLLKFRDENGEEKSVRVDSERFTVGRQSTCDLSIPDGRLSREHLRIERFGDVFVATDCGSSNGTILNGYDLIEPAGLKNGDHLDLGGGVRIDVSISSGAAAEEQPADVSPVESPVESAVVSPPPAVAVSNEAVPAGIPMAIFIIAPILGLVVLLSIGGLIFIFSGNGASASRDNTEVTNEYGDDDEDLTSFTKKNDSDGDVKTTATTSTDKSSDTTSSSDTTVSTASPSPGVESETGRIELHGSVFLRQIAHNDPKAFLTTEQAQKLSEKIKQISGSQGLAANIASANKNAAQIRSIAAGKNMKPRFLAVAAIAKLGNTRGDVLQTAQGMAEILDKLGTQVGNELADDSLMAIAVYDQGETGDFMKLRNMLQDISTKSSESSRSIRTIWFLEKNRKISPAEFDRALNFLAVGVITQKPKDFNVNSETLIL